jgi:aconitate hydratase 2/2-methylisocitrate dehydratase
LIKVWITKASSKGLIAIANNRIEEIKSGTKPALTPDANAKYFAEVVIDLDIVAEPMIADPDVNNADVSKRYTHDTISLSFTAV